jgi:transposase-like protein
LGVLEAGLICGAFSCGTKSVRKMNTDIAVKLAKEGYSLRDIAETCGVSHETVRTALKKANVKAKQKAGRPVKNKFHRDVQLYARQGLSMADIAHRLRKTGESYERAYARVHHSMTRGTK